MSGSQPIAKQWPIGLGIMTLVLNATGGALVRAGYYIDYNGGGVYVDMGKYYAGITLCALGSICFIAWLVVFILFLVRRHHRVPVICYNPNTNYNIETDTNNRGYYYQNHHQQPQPSGTTKNENNGAKQPAATRPGYPVEVSGYTSHFCGGCGSSVQGRFCSNCGTAVAAA